MGESIERSAAPATSNYWRDVWLLIVLAPLVVAGCLRAPILGFDDEIHLHHPLMDVPLTGVFKATPGSSYFPLTILSYRLDRFVYGSWFSRLLGSADDAPGYRLTSLLLHLAAAVFIWRIFLNLNAGRWISLFAAAAWVVHPTACESVAWISERKNVLAAFFGFAALFVWCGGVSRERKLARLLTAGVLYLLAILSKPNAAGLFAVFPAYELILAPRVKDRSFGMALGGTAFAVLVGAYLILTVNLQGFSVSVFPRLGGSWLGTFLSDIPIVVRYIGNMLFPVSISFIYQTDSIVSVLDWRPWANGAALAGLIAITVFAACDRKLTVFLWCWFFAALAPALNVVSIWQRMQDRYAYFALPAMLAVMALAVEGAYFRMTQKRVRTNTAAAAIVVPLVLLALLTFWQSYLYQNDVFLFRDAVHKEPASMYAHSYLGQALSRDANLLEQRGGDPVVVLQMRKEAANECAEALGMPDAAFQSTITTDLKLTMGALLGCLGQPQHGRELLLQGMKEDSDKQRNLFALMSLARLEIEARHPREALSWLDSAGRASSPENPAILLQVGFCHEQLGESELALKAYRAVAANSPESPLAAARIAEILKKAK